MLLCSRPRIHEKLAFSFCAVCIFFLPCHDQLLVSTPTYLLSVPVAPSHGHVAFEAKGTDDMMLVQCSWFLVTAAAASCSCQKQTYVRANITKIQNTEYFHFVHCEPVCVGMWVCKSHSVTPSPHACGRETSLSRAPTKASRSTPAPSLGASRATTLNGGSAAEPRDSEII